MSESDEGSQKVVKEPPKEEPGKRFFINEANTLEGMALFSQLWNRDKCREPELAAHTFTGTVKKSETTYRGNYQEPPQNIDIVDFARTKDFRDRLLESNVIIYDLLHCNLDEADYVIKTLKTSQLTEPKTLVLLSSVMTWVNTPPKWVEEPDEKANPDEEEPEPEGDEQAEGEDEPDEFDDKPKEGEEEETKEELDAEGNPIERKKPLLFKEKDYHIRVPHEKFIDVKTIETLAMSAPSHQP